MDELHDFHQFDPDVEESQRNSNLESSSEEESSSDEQQNETLEINSELAGITSLIAINQTYLDLIERLMVKVERLIENNQKEQKKIKQKMGSKKANTRTLTPIYRSLFLPPYFKDLSNMVPVANDESLEIRRLCTVNVLEREQKPWSKEELRLLKHAIMTQLFEIKNKNLISRRKQLHDKIVNYQAQDGMDQLTSWREEHAEVSTRLKYLGSRNDDNTFKTASYDEIDWARIAFKEFRGSRSIMQIKMKWLFECAPHWNKSAWTSVEDEALKVAGKKPYQNWDYIASRLETDRTAFMCFERFHFLNKRLNSKRSWTTREDEKLLSMIDKFTSGNKINWDKVAAHMPDRNKTQCETRYSRSLNPELVHGRWTDSEDMLLIASINKYGPHDWGRIAQSVPGRTDVQCRARWVDNLDYKRSKAPWSADEDEAILVGIQVFGKSNFSSIAKLIPGRNTSAVKIRIRTLMRWKIAMVRNQELASNGGSGQIVEISRTKPEGALKRFNQLMEMSKQLNSNQHGFSFASRLGYGNYVISDTEQHSDYSEIKQKLNENFGKWFVSKNGRWVRLGKNPNEFGEDELQAVIDDLPEDKQKILASFLQDRSSRRPKNSEGSRNEEQDPEQTSRIAKLVDTVLVVDKKDLDLFYKNQQSKRLQSLKFSFKRPHEKSRQKRLNREQTLNTSFSNLIHNLAPKRYTIVDRLSDEITYRINQLPLEERRNYILRLMSELIIHQMDHEVQSKLNSLHRPIQNLKILNYLRKVLYTNNVVQHSDDNSMLPCTSSSLNQDSDERTTDTDLALRGTLQNLVLPSSANCNILLHFKNIIRSILMQRAKLLFPIVDEHFNRTDSITQEESFIDIQLSDEIIADPAYQSLKERMTRLLLLPMLFKRALESNNVLKRRLAMRELHNKLKDIQRTELENSGIRVEGTTLIDDNNPTLTNEQIIKKLNESLSYQVFDPAQRNSLKVAELISKSTDGVPKKRRRVNTQLNNRGVSGQITSVRDVVSANLKLEATNSTQIQPNTQPFQLFLHNGFPTPVVPLAYKPRRPQFSPAAGQTLSVRDFILMNQMPLMGQSGNNLFPNHLQSPFPASKKSTNDRKKQK